MNQNDQLKPPAGTDQSFTQKQKPLLKVVVFVFALLVIAAAVYYLTLAGRTVPGTPANQPQTGQNTEPTAPKGKVLFSLNLTKTAFAQVAETTVEIKPQAAQEKVKTGELDNLSAFTKNEKIEFSPLELAALENNGFYLNENNIIGDQTDWSSKDDFTDSYTKFMGSSMPEAREPQNALFITSDLALHLYHILVDRSFQRIEETKFQPMTRAMTAALLADSVKNYNSAVLPELKDTYKRLSAYYLIPLVVLEAGAKSAGVTIDPSNYPTMAQYLDAMNTQSIANSEKKFEFSLASKTIDGIDIPSEIYDVAQSELLLINNAKGIEPSPLFTPLRPEFKNDYSQFVPRSHYTKNDVLKSYFIAMMWYGRMGFSLNSNELTRDALVITGQINSLSASDVKIAKIWSDMSSAIEFFVGEVDDLTAFQYTTEAQKVFGNDLTDEVLASNNSIDQFVAAAKKDLPAPRILSEAIMMKNVDAKTKAELLADTMQFRFMGQRFTLDAYIINKLTQGDESPDPETGQKLPTMPTALMPISLLAPQNLIVKGYLDAWINDPARIAAQNRQSDKVIAKVYGGLADEIKQYDSSVWTQNIYWSWLDIIHSLLRGYGDGYPLFMTGDNWQKKNLGTSLGTYTELKHDTLLYAKQSYAELGGGGPDEKIPPVVKGYVEPDLEFWNKIIALAKKTEDGLGARSLMPDYFKDRYDTFIAQAEFYRQIAISELKDEKISDDDFEKLRVSPQALAEIVMPLPGQELTEKDKRAGIIADIHTDAVKSQILYEATGKPYIIYTAIKDKNGTRLTRGAVFNHYEFAEKIDGRLTDELWQARIYTKQGNLPPADTWSTDLITN